MFTTDTDRETGRTRLFVRDAAAPKNAKNPDLVVRVQVAPPRVSRKVAVRDELIEDPSKLAEAPTAPPEAFWPLDNYDVVTDPRAKVITVYEQTPSGERREIKTYPADKYGVDRVGNMVAIRPRGLSVADRMAKGEQLRQQRLRDQARLEGINQRARERWAKPRDQESGR